MRDRWDEAAATLVELRKGHDVAVSLAPELEPVSLADAYRVQDCFRARWPHPVAAWKAGATAQAIQSKFGLGEPIAGPAFAPDCHASPARLPASSFPHLALESEFAFRVGREIAPSARPISRDEVLAAFDALVPAIEIVGPRFESLMFAKPFTAIADCALNAALVHAAPITNFNAAELAKHKVRLLVGGKVRAEGTGADVLGDPVNALMWTVDHLSQRGITLSPGQLLSTGSMTGIVYIDPEEDAVADFGAFGRVELRFTGAAHPKSVRPPG